MAKKAVSFRISAEADAALDVIKDSVSARGGVQISRNEAAEYAFKRMAQIEQANKPATPIGVRK